MNIKIEETEEYKWIKQYLAENKWGLMEKFGAHSLGIGWKKIQGKKTKQVALLFYVSRKGAIHEPAQHAIPSAIEYMLPVSGKTVSIMTDVVESEAAELE